VQDVPVGRAHMARCKYYMTVASAEATTINTPKRSCCCHCTQLSCTGDARRSPSGQTIISFWRQVAFRVARSFNSALLKLTPFPQPCRYLWCAPPETRSAYHLSDTLAAAGIGTSHMLGPLIATARGPLQQPLLLDAQFRSV